MNILVTGATGFIGRHLVQALLDRDHSVTAVARDTRKAQSIPWWSEVDFISCDIHKTDDITGVLGSPDILVHLAWAGLSDYKSPHHFERNLPADYNFIRSMVEGGVQRVLVTGTCLEYGMQRGKLAENMPTFPVTSYGQAKDSLRKLLQVLQDEIGFNLQWVRLFYSYGAFQNPNSLLAQLEQAIDNGKQIFKMSGGEQLRDYLPVEEVAERLVLLIEHPECNGIINCCKGSPVSVRRLVEQHIKRRGADISLDIGHYPYPDYEAMAFWGDSSKFDSLQVSLQVDSLEKKLE
jgi:nucleoside-diphosphate-sugar epimerase